MKQFEGRLFGGRLFAGKLFRSSTRTPGGGGRGRWISDDEMPHAKRRRRSEDEFFVFRRNGSF